VDNRRWILYVLGVTLLVPVLLEGWTFYSMIRDSVIGTDRPPVKTASERRYYGEGDEILPSTEARETLRELRLTGEGKRWTFHLDIGVENGTTQPYGIHLVEVVLQDGNVIAQDRFVRVEPGSSGKLEARVKIPAGTSPNSLRVMAGAEVERAGEESVKEILLSSVPVRRTSGSGEG
jgi:hypothetical protein